jgi:hypothetical protein
MSLQIESVNDDFLYLDVLAVAEAEDIHAAGEEVRRQDPGVGMDFTANEDVT